MRRTSARPTPSQFAGIREALGLFEEAVSERQRALDVNPDDWSLLLELGPAARALGAWRKRRRCAWRPSSPT
jgi:tetratricopeptide (TPR) repeat protein